MVVSHGAWVSLQLRSGRYRVRTVDGRDLVEVWAPVTDDPSSHDAANWTTEHDRRTVASVLAQLKRARL